METMKCRLRQDISRVPLFGLSRVIPSRYEATDSEWELYQRVSSKIHFACITICDLSPLRNSARSSPVGPSGGSLRQMEGEMFFRCIWGSYQRISEKWTDSRLTSKDVIDGWTLCVWLRGRNMKPKGKSWLQSSKDGLDAEVWHGARGLWFCGARIRFPTCLCGCWSCQSWGCKVLHQAPYLLPNRLSAGEDRSADTSAVSTAQTERGFWEASGW